LALLYTYWRRIVGHIITLTGPSGSGKTTIVKKLMAEFPDEFDEAISFTTRDMRPGETEGVEYYFISEEKYAEMEAAGEFLETVNFNGKNYGSTFAEADRASDGKDAFVIVEPHGVDQWVESYQGSFLHIFVKPPSREVLIERMAFQGRNAEQIEARLAHDAEVFAVDLGRYNLIVVNEDLETTCRAIRRFVRSQ
jgi:guanylate kinase